jgi:DNA-binding response OmpR family regulator
MPKATVLSVDDDKNLQTVVQHYLEDDGYRVLAAHSGKELKDKLQGADIDVVLLDLVLPDAEGLGLIATIKQASSARIIIVSGKSDTTEKIIGLEMGADDYITKPFEMRELAARIKAVMRRGPAESQDTTSGQPGNGKGQQRVYFGEWCLDRTQFQVFDGAQNSANLTTGEFKLLEALVLAPNRALTREYLFELTRDGGSYDVYDRAIDIQIARIRKKLGGDDAGQLIKTVRGVGYMFCGEIRKDG